MKATNLIILTLATSLIGCSSSSISVSKAKYAPQSRIFKYQTPHESSLTIVRDKGLVGSGCNASIFINGETAAKLEPGEKATFYLNEGDWIVGTSIESSGLCAFNPLQDGARNKTKARRRENISGFHYLGWYNGYIANHFIMI